MTVGDTFIALGHEWRVDSIDAQLGWAIALEDAVLALPEGAVWMVPSSTHDNDETASQILRVVAAIAASRAAREARRHHRAAQVLRVMR